VPAPPLLLSFDFEDWHQLVHRTLGRDDWDRRGNALERQTQTVLDLLDELGVKATFFMLGITVRRYPELAQEIARRGHEPATHGFAHERVFRQTRGEFVDDVRRSVELIAETCGRAPVAYRAPAFSINRQTPWAYEALAEAGIRYDSSQYDSPRIPHRIGSIPRTPYRLGRLFELPVAVAPIGKRTLPVGGGSYWRLLPERPLLALLHRAAAENPYPVLYFHPYETDPQPLRADLPPGASLRQRLTRASRSLWRNTRRTAVVPRLRAVAREFRLVSYEQVYADIDEHHGSCTRALSGEGVLV
jgi:polysaccharide deacetylase family protein (PEP-CTERM system associated)